MLQLSDVQADKGIQTVNSFCPTSDDFIELVNAATRRLMRRGDWFETAIPIYVCVFNGCICWPRYVGQVRRINMCNGQIPVRNLWYQFMVGVGAGGCGTWNSISGNNGWWGREVKLQQEGTSPVLQDIMGEGRLVRVYTRCSPDYGKTLTIYGIDNNGQRLMTQNQDGSWTDGVVLVMQQPFASTSVYVRSIERVQRDATQCPVDMYAYNATTNLLEELAHYEPNETAPTYSKTRLQMPWPWLPSATPGSACCSTQRGVLAMVKLRFIPAQAPTDLVLLPNIDALQKEIQAIRAERAGDMKKAKDFELDAIRELNRELEDNSPDDQFSAIDSTFGGAVFTNNVF
jgi:hypothetical protein